MTHVSWREYGGSMRRSDSSWLHLVVTDTSRRVRGFSNHPIRSPFDLVTGLVKKSGLCQSSGTLRVRVREDLIRDVVWHSIRTTEISLSG
ncbi:hypothetical protein L1987_15040 [Smallanthus sonchifolius]|uniref:Uncharacterized protein n=1 Tax=Smallanthus sonchifolius TaxID=185202 RepID=A0ACB9J5A2_9ASTR|nr:hypothetical protein L1987_15040 [Smallanthus sonchifolius]